MVDKKENKRIARTPTFTKYYVTNVINTVTEQDIRLEFFNEKVKNDKDEFIFLSDFLVIFSPIGAKKTLKELKDAIDVYEKNNGVIELKKEPKSKEETSEEELL